MVNKLETNNKWIIDRKQVKNGPEINRESVKI